MWFILLCIFIGAFILVPPLRAFIGQAILFFIVGLLAIFFRLSYKLIFLSN